MEAITNWTRMTKRQITFSIHVSYATPIENLERSIHSLRTMLLEHEGVDNETIMVNFDTFADSYYNLFFNFYTKTTVWAENLNIREDINYKIIEILGARRRSVCISRPNGCCQAKARKRPIPGESK